MRSLGFGLLLSVLTLPGQFAVAADCATANPEALAWLDKMSRSSSEVNYHGVVTFQRGDKMQVMHVSHTVVNGTATESMTQLTGQGAQVVRVDHPLQCVHPGHRLLRLSSELNTDGCGVANYYRIGLSDGERVAGRNAVRITIEPRDMYRFGYVMELDRQTGLLLKAEIQGYGNQVMEKFQFANLSYVEGSGSAISDAQVETVHHARHPDMTPPAADAVIAVPGWQVGWLPAGFMLTDENTAAADGARKTFTDGLSVFSVFLEDLAREIHPGEGVVRGGGTISYTRGMNLLGESVLVTVIGEIPLNTARMVADSIIKVER